MQDPHSRQPVRAGPAPPKYGSGTVSPGVLVPSGPKNTPTGVGTNVSPHTHVVGDLLDDAVGVGEGRVLHHAQHPLRLLVVRHQLGAPVGDVRPLPVVEERLGWHVERVGVVQRSTADAGAGQDHHVAQQVDALDAVAAELGRPQELAQVPGGLGEVLVGEAAAGLEHADAVALFGQPQRGDAAPETRTDDQDVVIRFHRTSMDLPGGSNPARPPSRAGCAERRRPGLCCWCGVETALPLLNRFQFAFILTHFSYVL